MSIYQRFYLRAMLIGAVASFAFAIGAAVNERPLMVFGSSIWVVIFGHEALGHIKITSLKAGPR